MSAHSYQFIDANLIMYSLGGPHPLRDPCKNILNRIKNGRILVVANTEVLQEILYRYFSIGRSTLGEMAYQALVDLCQSIFPVTIRETDLALDLLKAHEGITSRDAVHAATMINNEIKTIISTDSHFDAIPSVKRIDPRHFD